MAVGCNAILGIDEPTHRPPAETGGSAGSGGVTGLSGYGGDSGSTGEGAEAGTSGTTGGVSGQGGRAGRGGTSSGGTSSGRGGSSTLAGAAGTGTAGQGARAGSDSGGTAGRGGAVGSGGTTQGGRGGASGSATVGGAGGQAGSSGGSAGTGTVTNPSCVGETGTECAGESCCVSIVVPDQQFQLYDKSNPPYVVNASVTTFTLDKYEVTVSRFRRFLDDYDRWHRDEHHPEANEGEHPLIPYSGWDANFPLPADAASFEEGMSNDPNDVTLCGESGGFLAISKVGENPAYSVNCMSWFEAFAFCIWDGQRLPTESEWVDAALGGDNDNLYPWGNTAPTADRAAYRCSPGCGLPVAGTHHDGLARWGHEDMAGSMWEWALDSWAAFQDPMLDFAHTTGAFRMIRGGSFSSTDNSDNLDRDVREHPSPDNRFYHFGFRCGRSL